MEKEALLLAGKLAMASQNVIVCGNPLRLSLEIDKLSKALDEYNAYISSNLPEKVQKFTVLGVTNKAEAFLSDNDLESLRGMIGSTVTFSSHGKFAPNGNRLFVVPDGSTVAEVFIKFEEQ